MTSPPAASAPALLLLSLCSVFGKQLLQHVPLLTMQHLSHVLRQNALMFLRLWSDLMFKI